MSELKVYLSNNLSNRFRRIAMSVYGYGRGSLSKAAEDAISKWCEQHEPESSGEIHSQAPDTKTNRMDPEERPNTLADSDTSGNNSVKSTS